MNNEELFVALHGDSAIARITDLFGPVPNITLFPVDGKPLDLRHGLGSETIFFVSRFDQDSIIAVDTMSGQLLQDWILGSGPSYFSNQVDSNGIAYIPSEYSNILTAFNLNEGTIERAYRTGVNPRVVEVGRLGRNAYVTNGGDDTISIVDLVSGLDEVISLPRGSRPQGAVLAGDDVLLVTAAGLNSVYFLNLTNFQVQTTVTLNVGPTPSGIALSEDGTLAFITNSGGTTVSVMNLDARVVSQVVDSGRKPITVRVFGSRVLVSNELANSVSIFEIVAE
jgi:DNA-binding beta-propeller fold protein YncE